MPAKVVTVAQQKGGAGKTTLAAQLGTALAAGGSVVALMDIDPQGSLSRWYQVRMAGPEASHHPLTVHQVAGWRAGTELDRLRRDAEVIIIDSPPHAETEARIAIRAADLVVVPLQPSPMDLWATQPTLDMAARERVRAVIALNRVPPRGKVVEAIRASLDENRLPATIATLGNRTAFAASMMEGRGVVELPRRTQAMAEILALTEELLALLDNR